MAGQQEPKRISRCSLFAKGKKVGVATGGTFSKQGNDEDAITDDGWTSTDGTQTCEVKLDTITTVDGDTDSLGDAMDNKEFITVQLSLVDGKTHTIKMRVTTAEYTWANDKGSMRGSFTFRGGKPSKS
jgi:hypothetical protein